MTSTPDSSSPAAPNQFHLHGRGISVSYFPDGFGPPTADGPVILTYQDSHRALSFRATQVRIVKVEDLGTSVSATIVPTVDVGSTTFTLVIPDVALPDGPHPSVPISTVGITTVHRAFVAQLGHPQHDTYTTTHLTGTAAVGILPL